MDWKSWLAEVGMEHHAAAFIANQLDEDDVQALNHDLLRGIGVHIAKHRIKILQRQKKYLADRNAVASWRPASKKDGAGEQQSAIIERLRTQHLDEPKLLEWVRQHWAICDRDALIDQGYLLEGAPSQGLALLGHEHRSTQGEELLRSAKDLLWALLYGDESANVTFHRVERELFSLTVPQSKAFPFNFFQAVSEIGVSGTWRDPEGISNDEDARNILLQVEYGELASELVGDGIIVCIQLINLLEINEQILYARCSNVEQSTLLTELFFQKRSSSLS